MIMMILIIIIILSTAVFGSQDRLITKAIAKLTNLETTIKKNDPWYKKALNWWPIRYDFLPFFAKQLEAYSLGYLIGSFISLGGIKEKERKGSLLKASWYEHKELLEAVTEAIKISDISKYADKMHVYVDKEDIDNAFAVNNFLGPSTIGIGENSLKKNLPRPVLVAIILHELCHIKDLKRTTVGHAMRVVLMTLPFHTLGPIPLLLSAIVPNTLSYRRQNEFEADLYAATYVGSDNVILMLQDAGGVPTWLIKSQHACGILLPLSLLSFIYPKLADSKDDDVAKKVSEYFATHPSLKKRIERLEQFEKERSNFSINEN